MSKLIRYYTKGSTYFITVVTYDRRKILSDHSALLWSALEKMSEKHRASINAWVVLPDHFHLIITPEDNVLDKFVHDVKLSFGALYRKRQKEVSGRVWQSRYWDHVIRDEEDLNRHTDYIHYNPVKHGLVKSPFEWQSSSIQQYKENGLYQVDWGVVDKYQGEFGE